jgi:hypothetical protein
MRSSKRGVVTAASILQWQRAYSPVIRVKTRRDEFPNGLSAAMAPLFVSWLSSSAGFGSRNYYLVRNVNIHNNPVEGITLLGTVKVWADSVESVEFVMVISKVAGRETPGGHAMLRFIFREDRRPVVLGADGQPFTNDSVLDDIVLSWEAWRPPFASFDPVAGLDPSTYALTPRCLAGPVRCLADAVLDRPWHCYPLNLPEVENAKNELLYVSLALADAVARQTALSLMEERIEEGRKKMPEGYPDAELEEWETLAEESRKAEVPENPIEDILKGKIRYQLLERSCITMALQSVDWANQRIHERAGLGEPRRIRISPANMPAFLSALAAGDRTVALLRMPAALHWLMRNHTVIPSHAPGLLEEAGLLRHENGRIVRRQYDNRRDTPYGSLAENLIY